MGDDPQFTTREAPLDPSDPRLVELIEALQKKWSLPDREEDDSE